ncbi:MAG: adenosylcobinamide-GDP ribazoletransferase [Nitrospinae bacterium]|nr:adenosylcobinamide-GDP ribazoletransferase [Nitrospinota bacterium]
MKALAQAVRYLTVLPWPGAPCEPEADDMSRVLVRFPFVGLLIGVVLIALDWALASVFSVSVRSVLLITALIVLTRGNSLSGLSDFAESLGSVKHVKERPSVSMGVLFIIGALLLKFVALSELHGYERYLALLVSPILARATMAYIIASPPSVLEAEDAGRAFVRPSSPREGHIALGWSFLLSFLLAWFWGLFLAIVALCVTWGFKRLIGKSDKEVSGAPGATCEIIETMTLVLFSAW